MTWDLTPLQQQIVTAAAVGLEDAEIAEFVGSTGPEVKLVMDGVMNDLGLAGRL